MRFDSQDKQLLAALDKGFIIDGETASISGPITIKIVRTDNDRLQLTVEFANVEFPILLSRAKTLEQLDIKTSDS